MTKLCAKCGGERTQVKKGNSVRFRCRPCEREYQRTHYKKNPAEVRERKRLSMARQRSTPDGQKRQREIARLCWQNGRKERNQAYLSDLRERRFFVWRARNWRHGRVTARELAALWKAQRGRCALSGRRLGRDAHLDHVLPKSLGGLGEIDNLRWLDPVVNVMRQNMSDEQFVSLCAQIATHSQVAEWIGKRILEANKSMVTNDESICDDDHEEDEETLDTCERCGDKTDNSSPICYDCFTEEV